MKEKEIFEQFLQVSNVKKEDVVDYRSCTEFYVGIYIPNAIVIQLNNKYKNKEIIYTAFDVETVVDELSKTTENNTEFEQGFHSALEEVKHYGKEPIRVCVN